MRIILISILFLYLWLFKFTFGGDFECGEHGRFEYCIDQSELSCVIGCHCHPGYYFDTESKVCEPSSILIKSRRMYDPSLFPTTTKRNYITNPTPTTTDIIDGRVEAIAQDADDLGDWLYNQFFKTIENQVVNKTNEGPTRRSGSGSGPANNKRPKHTRKRAKKSSKAKQQKRRKGKHLRISENDSIFDDSSDSRSSDGSDSSSSSDAESGSSESKSEGSQKDHGHRKIIMINKKPRPPLPSFIFLPNVETSFYPPIGLPPPPAIPMFPMIPVPPMIPYPAMTSETSSSATTIKSNESTTDAQSNGSTQHSRVELAPQLPESPTENPIENVRTDQPPDGTYTTAPVDTPPDAADSPSILRSKKHKNFLRQIQNMMHPKRGPRPELDPINFMNPVPEPDVFGETSVLDAPMDLNVYNAPPNPSENVNFKYLTQLIHRKNLNAMDRPKVIAKSSKILNKDPSIISNRRMIQPTSNLVESDDKFYTNLGRQIASFIRNINTFNDNEMDNAQNSALPPMNWDRYARSPLRYKHIKQPKNNDANELLVLENRVQHVVTTPSVLSLHELENVISMIQKAKSQISQRERGKIAVSVTPARSYSVQLLPNIRKKSQTKSTSVTLHNVIQNDFHNVAKNRPPEKIEPPKSSPISILPIQNSLYNQQASNPSFESIMAYNSIASVTPNLLLQTPKPMQPNVPLNFSMRLKNNNRNSYPIGFQNNFNNRKAVPLINPSFLDQIRPSLIQPVYNRKSFFQPESNLDYFSK